MNDPCVMSLRICCFACRLRHHSSRIWYASKKICTLRNEKMKIKSCEKRNKLINYWLSMACTELCASGSKLCWLYLLIYFFFHNFCGLPVLQRTQIPSKHGDLRGPWIKFRRGVWYYAFHVQIFPRSFSCANFTQIGWILSMKLHLVPYGTVGT